MFRRKFLTVVGLVEVAKKSSSLPSTISQKKVKLVQFGTMAQQETFMYFAFGSNLWTKRIHENNRSANFVSVAKLQVNILCC